MEQTVTNKKKLDISLNGGVLIIGSLLWDTNQQRIDWRNNLLQVDQRIIVPAPIRYGRISTGRKCTFSMVFSNDCNNNNQLGTAAFVPFKKNPTNLQMLEKQTKELIKSERKRKKLDSEKFNWSWGTLAISVNPKILKKNSEKYYQAKALLTYWKEKYSNDFNNKHYKVGKEFPVLNKLGVLNFKWTKNLKDYDFIITTATMADREYYPNSKNIAERILVNEYEEYFLKNVEFDITTFQDKEILKFLKK